ncbi:Homocysteine S-methyltransferase [Mycena alexandri]|uniref:Homocysteine S-methyltransferase n=1 Tax=Mycena alexandri TaxID=1745969 RepID=A0AAD6S273_9AGAR|nr:Homocysteine S-methyltransferase [Mycena alexandri]
MLTTLPLYPHSSARDGAEVLDGGLGTTLETTFGLELSHTPLWSAKAVIEHPEILVDAHLAFLRAGAKIILTSTYQCSLSTFAKAGYFSRGCSGDHVKICPTLQAEARSRFNDECANSSVPGQPELDDNAIKIALSLGPFGAGLSPAQEFDGYYPPPFGPRGYTHGGDNRNAFFKDDKGQKEEEEATVALAQFHLERLRIFANDKAVWSALDFIAFETVPLLLRAKGIESKPWWISFVFPGGKFPETSGEGDNRVDVRSVVAAALQNPVHIPGSEHLPIPSALGVISTILADMERAVEELSDPQNSRPWLVIYPNAGDTYDPLFADMGHPEYCIWSGVVAGGCCRTGPEDIRLLNRRLASMQVFSLFSNFRAIS